MANKEKVFNVHQIEALASIGCTQDQIAKVMLCSVSAFKKHLKEKSEIREAYERGKNNREISIRTEQTKSMKAGSVKMQIYLGKVELGQCDKPKVKISYRGCKTRSDKMDKVNAEVAKGKIAPDIGKTIIDCLERTDNQDLRDEMEAMKAQLKEMSRKLDG